jgi:drug/metabolite transporter (DMT)-like permease
LAFLHERLDPGQWLGVAIVSLAVIAILRRTEPQLPGLNAIPSPETVH